MLGTLQTKSVNYEADTELRQFFLNQRKKGQNPELPQFDVLLLGSWVDCFDLSTAAREMLTLLQLKDKFFGAFVCNGGIPGRTAKTLVKFARESECKFLGYGLFKFISNNYGKEKEGMIGTVPP